MDRGGIRRGRGLLLAELPPTAPCFLEASETLFLALRGRSEELKLLGRPEEVFGRAEVRCQELSVRPTDFLGNPCLHCGGPTSELPDFLLCVRSRSVVAAFHETCFKRWFVLQDKGAFGAYRFALVEGTRSLESDGMTKISVPSLGESAPEVLMTPLVSVEYTELFDPGIEAEAAFVRKQGAAAPEASEAGAAGQVPSDTNILFCPHCDHPNRVAFLETEGAHRCARCQGRYGVKIVAL